jgi:hypothetical protein
MLDMDGPEKQINRRKWEAAGVPSRKRMRSCPRRREEKEMCGARKRRRGGVWRKRSQGGNAAR